MERRLLWAATVLLVLPVEAMAQPRSISKALTACIVQAAEENRPVTRGRDQLVAQIACDDDGAKYFYDALEALGAETKETPADGTTLITRRFGNKTGTGASECQRKINPAGSSKDEDYHCWIDLDVNNTVMSGWEGVGH